MSSQPPYSDEHHAAIGADDPYWPERPLPRPRWHQLFNKVGAALIGRSQDPDYPFAKIGPYDAEGVLGNGSHGCVYKVRDLGLDHLVALKICALESRAAANALMAEARILAKLSHPNIVTVHGSGTHEGDVYFVMEFVDGLTLSKYAFHAGDEPPGWEELVELFCVLGLALAAAHDAGVAHGDFKPANVMLDGKTKTPYIVDFGLARHIDSEETDGGGGRGTLHYMAPEVLRGGVGDALSDQYSFCVSLWQCLDDGPTPYGGNDSEDLLVDIEAGSPPFDNPDVPERVRDVLRRGMSPEPEARYPDMHALVHALRLALGPRVVLEPRAPGSTSQGKHSGLIALVVVLAIGLLIQSLRKSPGLADEPEHAELTGNLALPDGSELIEAATETALPDDSELIEAAAEGEPIVPDEMAKDAVEADGSDCATSPWEPSSAAEAICTSIRRKHFAGANELWASNHRLANPQSAEEWVTLIHDTLTIAQTFEAEGDMTRASEWHTSVCFDYRMMQAAAFTKEAEERLSSAMEPLSCK